jgi:hypothetical protein
LSARGTTHWTEEVERGDIRLRTETFSEMTSDKTEFRLWARLEAYENDAKVYEKEIRQSSD